MGRTGTVSLKAALETIYKAPCYHSLEIRKNRRVHILAWECLLKQLQADSNMKIPSEQIYSLLEGYRSSTGTLVSAFYRQLMDIYPEAKFILSVRDSQSWIESLRATVLPKGGLKFPNEVHDEAFFGNMFLRINTTSFRCNLGANVDLDDDHALVSAFEHRIRTIENTIPADRLLVYRVEHGWKPLCEFLEVPVPNAPFPWLNTREEFIAEWNAVFEEVQ
ncbi:Sulfotransferase family protein [Fasciola hepatica]|uniref:Sulfotransferase family protein n=1 Tax=Fasciola hepatica TaxID=6192 RepID=A0A2H1CN29_FASHE|nr:Sulfotransferase family protein [Fasciola hepatica]